VSSLRTSLQKEADSNVKSASQKQREYAERHPERIKEYRKQWIESGRSAEYQRRWKKQNPESHKKNMDRYNGSEKSKACQKRYNDNNKEKRRAVGRRWYQKNKEKAKARSATYFKTPKGRLVKRACDNKRRGAGGTFTAEDIKDLYATQGGRCYYCSVEIESGYHIEHMTPLSRGGRNDVSNICLACAPCNLQKHTKTAEEFKGEQK